MQLNAYCVYDNKSLTYGVPFFAPTDGSAVRSFKDVANDVNTSVGRHPGDYVLYYIGTYDDERATLVAQSPLRHVIDATALLSIQKMLPLEGTEV